MGHLLLGAGEHGGNIIWSLNILILLATGLFDIQNNCHSYPDSTVHGANMGPIWGRQDPGGPHVGPMNLAIWVCIPDPVWGWIHKGPVMQKACPYYNIII